MKTTTEYAVKAETHDGDHRILRRGFASRAAAESHPVTLKFWKRVWVEAIGSRPVNLTPVLPPKPWDWMASETVSANGKFHAYLVDAVGRKIAAIWGTSGEKQLIADHIMMAVNDGAMRETLQILVDLLDPLRTSLNRQTYDQQECANFDPPRDAKYAVMITAKEQRDLTQAVCILENRLRLAGAT